VTPLPFSAAWAGLVKGFEDPSPVEAIPKLNRIWLYRELLDAPRPVALNAFVRPINGIAIHLQTASMDIQWARM
jgi:hypothetical protein